jgi:hypothetical protein
MPLPHNSSVTNVTAYGQKECNSNAGMYFRALSITIVRLEISEAQRVLHPLVSCAVYPGIKRPKCENQGMSIAKFQKKPRLIFMCGTHYHV